MKKLAYEQLIQQLQPFLKSELSAVEKQQLDRMLMQWNDHPSDTESLKNWLQAMTRTPHANLPLPIFKAPLFPLGENVVAVLFSVQDSSRTEGTQQLEVLLRAYFACELLVLELSQNEWLLLLPAPTMYSDGKGMIAGLHSILESEWLGGVRMSVSETFFAAERLPDMVNRLRQTLHAGALFAPQVFVYFAGEYELELWVMQLSEEQRNRLPGFVEWLQMEADAEMVLTLQQFLAHGCSMSETAKALHIHRNTLVYRLDKFKQDSGFDVRTFEHAMHVKLLLIALKLRQHRQLAQPPNLQR